MKEIIKAAQNLTVYQQLIEAPATDKNPNVFPPNHPTKSLVDVWHQLSLSNNNLILLNNSRILIPQKCRKQIMDILHKPHTGLTKSLAMACKHYFWPKMKNDLSNMIDKCENCHVLCPSLPHNTIIKTMANSPMEKLSMDLFEIQGKHYLIAVNRYSGLPWL